MEKTKQKHVLPKLKQCYFATTNFDLWMLEKEHGVFDLVINFLSEEWQPQHIVIRLFEASEIIGQAMARNLTKLLDQYDLRN